METLWPKIGDSLELAADTVQVWAVPLAGILVGREHWEMLSPDEQQRTDEFRLDEPRLRFVVGRVVLRTLLGRQFGRQPHAVSLVIDANGKPSLGDAAKPGTALHFNVAHSGDLVLIALSHGCEVGVDIECLRPVSHSEHIAKRYFHPDEIEAIMASPSSVRDAAFMQLWTAKEAVLKAVGSGITGTLSHFCVPADFRDGAWIELPAARCWLQPLNPAEGYMAAIACVDAQPQLRCFELEVKSKMDDRV